MHRAVRLSRRELLCGVAAGAWALLAACQTPTSPVRQSDARPGDYPTPEPRPTQAPTSGPKVSAEGRIGEARLADDSGGPGGPPKTGGRLVGAAEADPLDLDPYGAVTTAGLAAWGDLVYQGLVMYDERMKLVPCLAESWVNTSPTTWTFKLRQGVRFHDGTEFEADDVLTWFQQTNASARPDSFKPWQQQIAGIEVVGGYEIELTLSAPYAPLLPILAALRGTAMAPRGWLQRMAPGPKTTAVGSGPFKLVEYVPGSHLRYVKHADYWERRLPLLDEIVLEIEPNEASRVAALRSGQLKYAMVGVDSAQRLRSEKGLTVLASSGGTQLVTRINASRPPFDDPRVRRAIAAAVDRRQAIDRLLGGAGRLTGPIPSGLGDWAAAPEPTSPGMRPDVAAAKRLLSDAGHPDGFEATVKASPDQPNALALATLLADQLRPLGISVRVDRVDVPALARAVETRDFDIVASVVGFSPDPDGYLVPYTSNGRGGVTGGAVTPARGTPVWANPRYDELIQQARAVLDPGQRKLLYDEATAILLAEVPAIWWCTLNRAEVIGTGLKGYSQSFTGRRPGLKRAWLDD